MRSTEPELADWRALFYSNPLDWGWIETLSAEEQNSAPLTNSGLGVNSRPGNKPAPPCVFTKPSATSSPWSSSLNPHPKERNPVSLSYWTNSGNSYIHGKTVTLARLRYGSAWWSSEILKFRRNVKSTGRHSGRSLQMGISST